MRVTLKTPHLKKTPNFIGKKMPNNGNNARFYAAEINTILKKAALNTAEDYNVLIY